MSVSNTCAWPLDLLCSSDCPACRCLATAKAGNHSYCMDFERDFRTASLWTGQTQLLLVCFIISQKEAPTVFSGSLAGTRVCNPEQNPFLFVHSLILGWPAGCAECRRLEKCSALCVTPQKHEDAFEERKDPAGQQMENRKRKTSNK